MSRYMKRIPEPERMQPIEEIHYAKADYAKPHEEFVGEVLGAVGRRPGVRLVDLGCGPGDILVRLSRRGVDWQLYGLDFWKRMLGYARDAELSLGPHRAIRWIQADIKATSLPTAMFGAIISNSVLHHVEDAEQFWLEVGRLAEPCATVLLRDLRRPPDEQAARIIIARHIGGESSVVRNHYLSSLRSAYTVDEIRAQLQAAGIAGLKVRKVADRYLEVFGRIHCI